MPHTPARWSLAAVLLTPDQPPPHTLLEDTAHALQAAGWRVGGLSTRHSHYPSGSRRMQLLDVRSGALHDISQDRGPNARGCCLNTDALARASAALRQALQDGVDLLLINRFGSAEAEGHGFNAEFAQAIQAGVPVITTVAPPQLAQWQHFTGGHFHRLPHHPATLLQHCQACLQAGLKTSKKP